MAAVVFIRSPRVSMRMLAPQYRYEETALLCVLFKARLAPLRPKLPGIFSYIGFKEDERHRWMRIAYNFLEVAIPPGEDIWYHRFSALKGVTSVSWYDGKPAFIRVTA